MSQQLTLAGIVRPTVLGVGGCSGSGKTTLARELADQLNATLFPLDFYYRDLAHLSAGERNSYNFDHPESLEHDLIVDHVQDLRDGRGINRPTYDFSTHSRVAGVTEHIEPQGFLIVEGILALHYQQLLPLFDYTVYVDAPHEVCLMRRIHRDTRERGRTEASVREQFEVHARPMADTYVVPCRTSADLTVSGTEALDWSIELVLAGLHKRGLLRDHNTPVAGGKVKPLPVRALAWLHRALVAPLVRMLRRGASPRRLAWSLAVGMVIGINPVLGSTTVLTLAVAHFARLNHSAAQIGTQAAYPAQLLLLLPFLRAGAAMFRSRTLEMQAAGLVVMARKHPLQMVRALWTWEWHALIVWALAAVLLIPLLSYLLRFVLERTMHTTEPIA